MPSLYDLTTEIRDAIARLDDGDGELTPEAAAALDGLQLAFEEKAEGVLRCRVNHLAAAEGIDVEVRRLTALRDAHQRRADSLKRYLFDAMTRTGIERVDTRLFKVWVQQSAPAVVIDADAADGLPERFVRVKREPDRAALLAAAKAGEQLPAGVSVQRSNHLRIK